MLLDKVTARYVMQGLRKLSDQHDPTPNEELALEFFTQASQSSTLYIVPATHNILLRIQANSHHKALIDFFLSRVEVAYPTKYHKRWARRLRTYRFSREDAAILALGTFSTDIDVSVFGMEYVLTFDQPMINNWTLHQPDIYGQLETMKQDLSEPYCYASLPHVLRPDDLS